MKLKGLIKRYEKKLHEDIDWYSNKFQVKEKQAQAKEKELEELLEERKALELQIKEKTNILHKLKNTGKNIFLKFDKYLELFTFVWEIQPYEQKEKKYLEIQPKMHQFENELKRHFGGGKPEVSKGTQK